MCDRPNWLLCLAVTESINFIISIKRVISFLITIMFCDIQKGNDISKGLIT